MTTTQIVFTGLAFAALVVPLWFLLRHAERRREANGRRQRWRRWLVGGDSFDGDGSSDTSGGFDGSDGGGRGDGGGSD
jgi:hypothetical protein